MKIHPNKDYLLTKPVAIQETRSGLVLAKGNPRPGDAQATMVFAEVVEAGPDAGYGFVNRYGVPRQIEKGDVVAFHPGAGQVINDGNEDFVLVKVQALVASLEDWSTVVDVKDNVLELVKS